MKAGQRVDTVIIGGGLVGTSAAFHLLAPGRELAVVTGVHDGRASHAAAGMLTPTCEWSPETTPAYLDFLRAGNAYYEEFLARLMGSPGSHDRLDFSRRQFLLLSLLEDDADLLARLRVLHETGSDAVWLTADEVVKLEPNVNPAVLRGAIQIFGEGVINPRALHQVLTERLDHAGVPNLATNVNAVHESGDDFVLSLDNGAQLTCARVVIAAGAWSCEVAAMFGLTVPVSVSKGQIVQLAGPTGLLDRILYMPVGACGCLLERSPGVYIAGTSEEYVTAEVSNTSRVVAAILNRVNEVFPLAGEFAITDMWSGFRPITPDELPIIGASADPRVVVAAGHYRNGVLMSPLTGRIVRSIVDDEEPPIDLTPFAVGREFPTQYRFAAAY